MTRRDAALYLLTHPAELGRRLGYTRLTDELHGEWMREMLTREDDMTLQAHRGAYKTTCLTIVISLLLILERDKNIIFLRKTDADVAEVITQTQRIISSPIMQQCVEAVTGGRIAMPTATKTAITTTAYNAPRGAEQLLGIGMGGSLTGKHADIIITDDIVNRLDRTSAAERERTRAIYQELQNIKNRGGRIINTGTPWHIEDAFALMPQATRYDCYTTGLITPAELDKLRASMAPSLFAANYELRHIAAEDALFRTPPRFADGEESIWDGVAHVDAAYGGGDSTALTCMRRVGDTVYAYGRMWHAHVDTVMDAIVTDMERLRCAPVYCETNGDKGYLARELRGRGVPVRPYHESQNKYYKIATHLAKWWPGIVWLRGTDPAYLQQVMGYSAQAEHDDAPDSAASLCRVIERRG